jgi:hypothetical protein
MTDPRDPLEEALRGTIDRVPVPFALEARIRASVARRRRARIATVAAAAALLFIGLLLPWRREVPEDPGPPPSGPRVLIADPPAAPLQLREVGFTATVTASGDGLVIRFPNVGGPAK